MKEYLIDLPDVLLLKIFDLLPNKCRLLLVCRRFKNVLIKYRYTKKRNYCTVIGLILLFMALIITTLTPISIFYAIFYIPISSFNEPMNCNVNEMTFNYYPNGTNIICQNHTLSFNCSNTIYTCNVFSPHGYPICYPYITKNINCAFGYASGYKENFVRNLFNMNQNYILWKNNDNIVRVDYEVIFVKMLILITLIISGCVILPLGIYTLVLFRKNIGNKKIYPKEIICDSV